jgi:Mn2+/Fe2+ NRAMP family transporter
MVPAFALIAAGADPVRLLIVSQVALSVVPLCLAVTA